MFNLRERRGCKNVEYCSRVRGGLSSDESLLCRRKLLKLVTIKKSLLDSYSADKEILQKTERPCVLVICLLYKGQMYDFAVPLRSNISAGAPQGTFFSLPTRKTTKDGNRHGLHYIKMFPVAKPYLVRYRTEGNEFSSMIQRKLDANCKQIVTECQHYLDEYAKGNRPRYSTDIDFLLDKLAEITATK